MNGAHQPYARLLVSTAAVFASMLALFVLPTTFFVALTFAATAVMATAAYFNGGFKGRGGYPFAVGAGLLSAAALYLVFYLGNAGVNAANIPGVSQASEKSIYALIASPQNPLPLQVAVLAFDAVGYESFFRGTLQARLTPRIGVLAAPAVALLDASLHLATFNLLWVGTTFVADLVWGLTYHFGRGLPASVTSHFAWDVAIFILRPIV